MPRKKEYNPEEVIEKAMQVFWAQGYSGTSMRNLQEEMGINLFSIYAGFANKKGVFLESLKRYMQLNKQVILLPLLESQGDIEDIRCFFEGFITSVKSGQTPNGCLFANTAMELGAADEEVAIQLQLFFQFLKGAYQGLLKKAQELGNIGQEVDLSQYANYLVGVTEGLALVAKVWDEQSIEDFIQVALSTLK